MAALIAVALVWQARADKDPTVTSGSPNTAEVSPPIVRALPTQPALAMSTPAAVTARASVLELHADGACGTALGPFTHQTVEFNAFLERSSDAVSLFSEDHQQSCALTGTSALTGAQNCVFMAGGGRARTPITCPGAGLTGTITELNLHIVATSCRGEIKLLRGAVRCPFEAKVDITTSAR